MNNLAIGFAPEHGVDWSLHVSDELLQPIDIANALYKKPLATESCCTNDMTDLHIWPSSIIMVRCTSIGPVIFARYLAGIHYPLEDQTEYALKLEPNHVTPKRM